MIIYRIAQDNISYDKQIDDLMWSGWGVANQFEQNNYARKGWDVAFRIARKCTREQSDIAIHELSVAAKTLMKEAWKLGLITNPTAKVYIDELRDVLSRVN